MTWTQEAFAFVEREWANGLSASQVATALERQLGLRKTRNSVIGVIHRRGLQRRLDPNLSNAARIESVRRVRRERAAQRKAAICFVPTKVIKPTKTENLSADRQLAKLLPALGPELAHAPANLCKFIPGDPAIDSRICGRATGHGPYCSQHIKLCYEPKRQRPATRTERTDERKRWLRQLEAEARA